MIPFEPGEVLRTLEQFGVQFVVIGGMAGRGWGSPTVTRDIDVAYERGADNLERLAAALRDLEARLRIAGDDDVDVLGQPAGVDGYDELAPNAVATEIGGVRVLVAHLDDLIRMKVAAGRPKDRIEVEVLAALRDERHARGMTEP